MTSIILIFLCCVTLFAIGYSIWLTRYKNHVKDSTFTQRSLDETKSIVTTALKEMNCKCTWTDDHGDQIAKYDYQSGHFRLQLEKSSPYAKLNYPFFFSTPLENFELVRNLSNQCNLNTENSRVVYSTNNEHNSIDVHIVAGLWFDEANAQNILERAMVNMFRWHNIFVKHFNDLQEANARSQGRDLETDQAHFERETYLIREQELMHQAAGPEWRESEFESITLRRVLAVVMALKDINVKRLTVTVEDSVTVVNAELANDYDLSTSLIAEGDFKHRQAVLNLTFEDPAFPDKERQMTIHLKAEKRTRRSLYYRISLMLVPLSAQRIVPVGSPDNQVQSISLLVAFDLISTKELTDEFRYMWKEALEKAKAGELDSLTDEQRLIYDCMYPQLAGNLYRGRVLMEQERYMEAIKYLEIAFTGLSVSINGNMPYSDRFKFGEVAYLTGFCYNQLHQYRQAYYYLELVLPFHRVNYTEEYINCLVNSGDFRASSVIDELIAEIENVHPAGDESLWHQNVKPFLNFLNRRKAYVAISQQRYDEAESLLKKMLDDPENSDFALNELAYIQKIKEGN